MKSLVIEDEAHQKVIDMASMTGNIDTFVVFSNLVQTIDIVQNYAIVDFVPDPVKKTLE